MYAFKIVHINQRGFCSSDYRLRPGDRVQCLVHDLITIKNEEVDWPAAVCG